MRVLVTGASGHIGSAVVPALPSHGHQVVGLARSDTSAAAVAALGAEVLRGDLTDPGRLAAGARDADGVVHLAFDHALMQAGRMAEAAAQDLTVVTALGEALGGTGKPFVSTSVTPDPRHGRDHAQARHRGRRRPGCTARRQREPCSSGWPGVASARR